ncbi:hypothetical protein BCR25_16210 [Enterococcus termitis]|uniref:Uncharacterized protein n=1 Tax=Enterococcus termitis TaxID=332950 RepID=A0A1E5H0A4_9ENTE|nr:hypothetical protein BCR25_16210 [Enterococcus termitis]
MKMISGVKSIITFIGLSIFLVIFTVIIPFIVQERLMILLTFIFLILTIFNGKINSNQKIKYNITLRKDE